MIYFPHVACTLLRHKAIKIVSSLWISETERWFGAHVNSCANPFFPFYWYLKPSLSQQTLICSHRGLCETLWRRRNVRQPSSGNPGHTGSSREQGWRASSGSSGVLPCHTCRFSALLPGSCLQNTSAVPQCPPLTYFHLECQVSSEKVLLL